MPKELPKLVAAESRKTIKNAEDFREQLSKLADAKVGVIVVRTREPYRCQTELHRWSIKKEWEFLVWTYLTGWQIFPKPDNNGLNALNDMVNIYEPEHKDPSTIGVDKALEAIYSADAKHQKYVLPPDRGGMYVFMYPHETFKAPQIQQYIRLYAQKALDSNKVICLMVPDGIEIPPEIETDVYIIDFKTPSHAELKEKYYDTLKMMQDDCLSHFTEADIDIIIQNAIGMSWQEFDQAIALTLVENSQRIFPTHPNPITTDEFVAEILKQKVEIIKKTNLLELMPKATMADVGGLDELKEWLDIRKGSFSDEAAKFGVDQPKGIMVAGPPGTGKSLVAKATATALNIPCIKFDIGKVFGKYVGESESRVRDALRRTEAMSPCVLFIDEVDKGLSGSGGGGDSGVTSRVFGTILTWLQENKSPVFVVMTANNVLNLPAELTRRGRLDEIFSVTFPTPEERVDILRIHTEKRGHSLTDAEYQQIADETDAFVGAELEAIAKDAIQMCFAKGKKRLTAADVLAEKEHVTPLSVAFAEKVNAMATWVEQNARPASRYKDKSEVSSVVSVSSNAKRRLSMKPKPSKLSGVMHNSDINEN